MALAQPRPAAIRFRTVGFTVAFNMSEQPAASVNCGYDSEGLPIGLQIIGRRFDDLGVLAIARAFEAIRAFEDEALAGAADGLIGSQRRDRRLASLSGRRKARKRRRVSNVFAAIFCQQGGLADEKVHGPVHGQRGRL